MGKARAENRAERRHEAVQGLFMRVDAYVPRGGGLPFSKRGLYDHMSDQNKITILGPDDMGVMVVDFKTAKGQFDNLGAERRDRCSQVPSGPHAIRISHSGRGGLGRTRSQRMQDSGLPGSLVRGRVAGGPL